MLKEQPGAAYVHLRDSALFSMRLGAPSRFCTSSGARPSKLCGSIDDTFSAGEGSTARASCDGVFLRFGTAACCGDGRVSGAERSGGGETGGARSMPVHPLSNAGTHSAITVRADDRPSLQSVKPDANTYMQARSTRTPTIPPRGRCIHRTACSRFYLSARYYRAELSVMRCSRNATMLGLFQGPQLWQIPIAKFPTDEERGFASFLAGCCGKNGMRPPAKRACRPLWHSRAAAKIG